MKTRALSPALLGLALAAALAGACSNDRIRRDNELVEVVSGEPGVGQQLPGVQRGQSDGGAVFGGAAPFQVDTFTQPKVQKVDILWVIDDSNTMSPKQDRVKANFTSFMKFLSDQQIDYHLGVVTTDTYDPKKSGRLQNDAGLPNPWIQPDGGVDPTLAFVTNASVGTQGSGDEKGLLAGMMALTPPLESPDGGANCVGSDCFLRSDAGAQLYTIIVSDEEDSSCAPIRKGGYSNEEGCDDAAASLPGGFGSMAYWSRFYSGIKGPGGVSRVAAITGTDSTFQICKDIFAGVCDPYINNSASQCVNAPDCSQFANFGNDCCKALAACSAEVTTTTTNVGKTIWCEVHQANIGAATGPFYQVTGVNFDVNGGFPGCVARNTDGGVAFTAYYAERYASVAKATGGVAASICDADYTPALEKLGLQASGLRSEFPLSRAPVPGSIVVTVNGAQMASGAATWQYIDCENSQPVNSIRFAKTALPPPNAKVAVSYDVNVKGVVCK